MTAGTAIDVSIAEAWFGLGDLDPSWDRLAAAAAAARANPGRWLLITPVACRTFDTAAEATSWWLDHLTGPIAAARLMDLGNSHG
jgi:hypothetical protein